MTNHRLRERYLTDEAEKLLEARSRATGVHPRALLQQVVRSAPDPEEAGKSQAVAQLLERLAQRDKGLQP